MRVVSFAAPLFAVTLLAAPFFACASTSKTEPVRPAPIEVKPQPKVVHVEPPKIGLVLGGGGARGFAHVGVLRVLTEEKIPIDLVVGTSVGSLIGALYASDPNIFELEWKAFSIKEEDLLDYSLFAAKTGPVKGEAIKAFVAKSVKLKNIEDFPVSYIAVATDLNTGERVDFKSGSVVDAVRASVSIPGVFTPVTIGERTLVDGGVVANLAVDVAKENGAQLVIAANITENVVDHDVDDVVSIIMQSINIMMGQMAAQQLKQADVVITPDIGDVGTLQFDQKKRCMQAGMEATRAQIGAIKEAIGNYYRERGGVPPAQYAVPVSHNSYQ